MAGRLTFTGARETWRGMTLRAWGMQLIIVVQVAIIAMLALSHMRSDQMVVFAPSLLDRQTYVTRDQASIEYWEDQSLTVAALLGNVTPGNVDFVLSRLREVVAPEAYRRIIEVATSELTEVRNKSMSILFEAQNVIFDPALNRYFVTGRQHIILASGRRSQQNLTFEMGWRMENYRPQLTHIDTYVGMPRTAASLAAEQGAN